MARTTTKGDRLLSDVEKAARVAARKERHNRDGAKLAELAELLSSEPVRAKLSAVPHPHPYRASLGETLLDSIEFSTARAGTSGKLRALAEIRKVIDA